MNTLSLPQLKGHKLLTHSEHDHDVTAQSAKSYEDLMRENALLRANIRQANASIERMLGEVDVMVAKMKGAVR